MKTSSESQHKEKARSAAERPVGAEADKLDAKKKKLMNLKEDSQHASGKEKLATDEVAREVDGNGKQ